MDVGTIFPYLRYMPGSGDFGEGDQYTFDTSNGDYGQVTLSPSWQLSNHSGTYPTDNPSIKRVTMQVAQLNYHANDEVAEEITNDMQSKKVLMDFNTEDLYTKARGSDEWEGPWPQFDREYAKVGYGDDTDTIRPIKGAPVRFRKIPLCTTQGTGYFYALASAPYIITGVRENNPSKETGYLSDWTPTDTQLSIDCCGADITGNFFYASLFEMFPDLSEEDDIADIYKTGYSNLFSGITKNAETCRYDLIFRSITGAGCVETIQDNNLIYISGTSSITGNHYPVGLEETFDEFQLRTYSNIYSGNAGNTCSGNLIFRSITGAGCIETVLDRNIIFVSGSTFVTGNNIPIDNGMSYDESLLQTYSNIYSGNKAPSCSGDLVFRSITGYGTVSTSLDGNIIKISGASGILVTGTGCFIETFREGDLVYVSGAPNFYDHLHDSNIISGVTKGNCGSGIGFYNITGSEGVGAEITKIDDRHYINITGGGFSKVTGTTCAVGTGITETSAGMGVGSRSTGSTGSASNSTAGTVQQR